jgi:hypothetical protein
VDNLAYACLRCNLWKGTDIGSIDSETGKFVSYSIRAIKIGLSISNCKVL